MAFYSGFFNSKGLDRTYTAEDFTSYLSSIICNGILDTYGQMFKLTAASSGLKVTLGTGKAWIDGHYFINDARYSIDLTQYQDESLPRYVAIAILLDVGESVRSVSLEITPGTPAENPTLPSLPSDENKTRLLMYAVRLNPGATDLTERDWYDYREDKNVCGYCKCILGKCKVTELMAQMAQLIAEISEYNKKIKDLTNKVEILQTKVDDLTGDIVETGEIGENAYYVLYSNGRLLLRGSGATYDYEIGRSPFWENENIRSLVISDGITAIGSSVFERCSNMATASLPTSLTEIGKRAFFMYNLGGLTALSIPSSVTTIGEKAFSCEALTSVTLPATLTTLGNYLFMDSSTLTTARVECYEVPGFCFVRCTNLKNVTLSHNVTSIGSHWINYCNRLTQITYEGSLDDWATVSKGTSWDGRSGQLTGTLVRINCLDGFMEYDDENNAWVEVRD
ncbi:leucine-rich repeat domain-containing protein [Ruminococcus champanellensis]|uniref:leucine-rich repeat domain-containing protein n=1 Tax=Ruminococcus champanellensis TaxID=1161942 RepID=UPI002E774502|nr:leucine-rich repeat domain-containing protein [Ruminococcus champanellensis]MED9891322.1 leucine-rich repeat domain-containing protein [Ruminococcus champanellensis]